MRLNLPFFDEGHRRLARDLDAWCADHLADDEPADVDARCRELVAALGRDGWLRYTVPATYGGALPAIDSRALCVMRATLAYHAGLADFAFAMQGLGSGAVTLAGTPRQQADILPRVASGEWIAAFALSEPEAGSDVAALTMTATRDGDSYVLNGTKTWISNGGIADVYTVFARTEPGTGARGISAFIVLATAPGLEVAGRIAVVAPHPLAALRFTDCRIPADHLLGEPGAGFKLAMQTLDIFRASVAAAATGFARRALEAALAYARERHMFGQTLADLQLTQAKLADMATELEATELLTWQAAWLRDVARTPTTREVAMAKLHATESAQRIIDAAVQICGARGVVHGAVTERLYREIRALRIYEGASEVQQLIIARSLLKEATA
jgi:acyl-CoA dehydrogenase